MIEMEVGVIYRSAEAGFAVLALKEKEGDRYLVTTVDLQAADLLKAKLQGMIPPHTPLHPHIKNLIEVLAAGRRLSCGLITEAKDDYYRAVLHLQDPEDSENELVIYCQLIDTLFACLDAEVSFFCEDKVLQETGWIRDERNGAWEPIRGFLAISEEGCEKLENSAFGSYINTLNFQGI